RRARRRRHRRGAKALAGAGLASVDPRHLLEMGERERSVAFFAAAVRAAGADGLDAAVDEREKTAQPLDGRLTRLARTGQRLQVAALSVQELRELLVDLGAFLQQPPFQDLDLLGCERLGHRASIGANRSGGGTRLRGACTAACTRVACPSRER